MTAPPRPLDEAQKTLIHTIAKEAAKEAAKETLAEFFFAMGYDLNDAEDRKELITDLIFLRKQRETYASMGSHTMKVILGVIAIAVCTAVWQYVKLPFAK